MIAQLGQTLGIQPEIVPGSSTLLVNQPDGFQHLQMLRNGGAADRKLTRKIPHSGGPLTQQIQDCLSRGVRKDAQQLACVSHTLR